MRSAHPDIRFLFGQGSPLVDITRYVVSDSVSLGGSGVYEEGTPFGTTAIVNEAVGLTDQPDVTLDMFYNDEDDGPADVFGAISDADTPDYTLREILTKGSPHSYIDWPCAIKSAPVVTKRKGITRMQVVLTSRGPSVHSRQGA